MDLDIDIFHICPFLHINEFFHDIIYIILICYIVFYDSLSHYIFSYPLLNQKINGFSI